MNQASDRSPFAEGVEDAETLEQLRGLGVDHAPGYYIGKSAGIGAA
jgi:EAL domain-containing protein (putative c-di-GMP-specific phosphodiesterase class I)